VIRLAGCGQAGAAMQLRAEQRIAKRGRRNQVDQRIGIVAGDRHTRGQCGDAALMQLIGDVEHDQPGSLRSTAGIDRGEPNQPLGQPVTKGVEYSVERRAPRYSTLVRARIASGSSRRALGFNAETDSALKPGWCRRFIAKKLLEQSSRWRAACRYRLELLFLKVKSIIARSTSVAARRYLLASGQPALFPTLRRLWGQYNHFGGCRDPVADPWHRF
jgi:hypothetical protein